MSNPEHFPSDEQAFFESITEFPSIAIQQERLSIVMERYQQEWHTSGLLNMFVDHMPDPSILAKTGDVDTGVRLYSIMHVTDDSSHEQQEIGLAAYVTRGEHTANIFQLPLVVRGFDIARDSATTGPASVSVDEQQAALLAEQFDMLHDLRHDGILPNLQPGTCTIVNPATAIRAQPKSPEQ